MALNYPQLDGETRLRMLSEFDADVRAGKTYVSKRFTERGRAIYQDALREAIVDGNDDSLAERLRSQGAFAAYETSHKKNGEPYQKAVPWDAHMTYSEGEFNRYYIRAICLRAIQDGQAIEVVRAKDVENPRSSSIALIGTRPSAAQLLEALRTEFRIDNAFGIPPGPNSGLSVALLIGVPA